MTTTETLDHEAAHNLLVATAASNRTGEIGTPTSAKRNYGLTHAMACVATCDSFTLTTVDGTAILTGHNRRVGDYLWYIVTTPHRDPWD